MDTTIEPEVVFNMDLANAPTGLRFCQEAFETLRSMGQLPALEERKPYELSSWMEEDETDPEMLSDAIDYWNDRLSDVGFYAHWDAGDVVVFDLRPFSDEERESFFESCY